MAQAPATDALTDGPPAVGAKLQTLRQARKLSLDELSRRAGVSKSMLSQVERNLANPTVAVLWRLATALRIQAQAAATDVADDAGGSGEVPVSRVAAAAAAARRARRRGRRGRRRARRRR